ncbi:unnamed protein product [Caenorhabditis nigoni]
MSKKEEANLSKIQTGLNSVSKLVLSSTSSTMERTEDDVGDEMDISARSYCYSREHFHFFRFFGTFFEYQKSDASSEDRTRVARFTHRRVNQCAIRSTKFLVVLDI